jgi:hypothetical protein
MKNLTTYENYGTSEIQENWDMQKESSCMSEGARMQLEKICEEYLAKEAKEYRDDENPDHTYEGYVNECGNYIKEYMGRPGYSSLDKPYAE